MTNSDMPSWLVDQIQREIKHHNGLSHRPIDTWAHVCWTKYYHARPFSNFSDEFAGTELDSKLIKEVVKEACPEIEVISGITPAALQRLGLWGEAAILHEILVIQENRILAETIKPIDEWGMETESW